MTRRQASGSESTKGPPVATPALATTMSTFPNRSLTSCATRAIASWSVTSAYQWPLSVCSRSETCFSSSGSSPTSATFAPRAESLRASSSPTPRAAPVTTATCPSRLDPAHAPSFTRAAVIDSVASRRVPRSSRSRLTSLRRLDRRHVPDPGQLGRARRSGAARRPARARARRGEPVGRADDDGRRHVNSRTPCVEIEPSSTCAQACRTLRGHACTIRAHASTMCGRRTGAHRRVLEDPPGDRRDRPERRPRAEDAPGEPGPQPPGRIGTTSDSATSRELPVLHSRRPPHAPGTPARPAAAITSSRPWSARRPRPSRPGARVAASTASRSSASASVLHAGLAGLRPWPRWS